MESQKTALIAKMNELAQEGKQLEGSFRTAHSLAPECTFDQAGAKFTCPPPVAPTPKKGK
jgi:hypothetical protein